jgi:hypothetical protein
MSSFVLLGTRPFPAAELSPASAGVDLGRAVAFIGLLRRWRLLDCFATGMAEADQPRAVLVMRASDPSAAGRLAAAWSAATGFDVTVWPLIAECTGRSA